MKKIICFIPILVFLSTINISCSSEGKNDLPNYDNILSNKETDFDKWKQQTILDFAKEGINKELLTKIFSDIYLKEQIIISDKNQPEKKSYFDTYLANILPKYRIEIGKKHLQENIEILTQIEKEYGVEKEFIVALWGIESDFGRNMGNINIVNAISNLAFEGRRRELFTKELFNVIKLIENGDLPNYTELKGSWAGAMGQCQFMPSTFMSYAIDHNGDGKKDIFNNKEDVFASIANYLSKISWKENKSNLFEVTIDQDFYKQHTQLIDELVKRKTKLTLNEWQKIVILSDQIANDKEVKKSEYRLVSLELTNGNYRYFLVDHNYDVVMKWNRSNYFATTVHLFAHAMQQDDK